MIIKLAKNPDTFHLVIMCCEKKSRKNNILGVNRYGKKIVKNPDDFTRISKDARNENCRFLAMISAS